MTLLAVEILESLVEFVITLLQLLDEHILVVLLFMSNLNLVNILKTVVVTVDIVLVGTLADVEHTHILTVDIENGGMTSLPIEINIRSHGALDNKITEVHVAEVITAITERE